MTSLPGTLRDDVRLLGELLGNTILEHQGLTLFNQIEKIRQLAKALALAQQYSDAVTIDYQPLVTALGALDDRDVCPSRAPSIGFSIWRTLPINTISTMSAPCPTTVLRGFLLPG
jgi:phosphoenolpyruvate carboxylase